jgi:hypothetical protein
MARPERFELPTYSSGGCRSIQLSYGRVQFSLHPDSRRIKRGSHTNPMRFAKKNEWRMRETTSARARRRCVRARARRRLRRCVPVLDGLH